MVHALRYTLVCTARLTVPHALPALVRRAVRAALLAHNIPRAVLSIVFVDDREMSRLHWRFLGKRSPTDVLSFDLSENSTQREPGTLEGEIVISVSTARREASRRRQTVAAETALYAVHGTLHLLGYDDLTAADAHRMHTVEDEILRAVGLVDVFGRRATRAARATGAARARSA